MLRQFYGDILPAAGNYCLTLLPYGEHVWADSLDELTTFTQARLDRSGLYFGTASFQSFANRKQTNVLALKALRLDIDAGEAKLAKHGPDAVYATQKEALTASVAFFHASKIAPTYIVSSGEGLHIYYCLEEAVEPALWLTMAKALSDLGQRLGLKIDPSVTEDSARVLRVPGAPHPNGKRVTVLKRMPVFHRTEALQRALGAPAPARKFDMSINSDLATSFQGPPSSALKVAKHCGALHEVAQSRGDVQEPFWRAMIGLVKRTVEGLDIAQEWSSGYDGYDSVEVERKFNAWTTGPTTCQEFAKHTSACANCPHHGKVKSPINLGLMTDPEIEALPPEQQTALAPAAPAAATGQPWDGSLPEGFSVMNTKLGKKVLVHTVLAKTESPTGEMVSQMVDIPFTFAVFWFSQWAEAEGSDDTAQVELNLWAGSHIKRYTMDQSLVASQARLLEYLSGKAIHTTTHKKAAQAMQDYAKAQLQHIHEGSKNLKVTDHLGLRTLDSGELVCAHGKYTIFQDGSVRETMLGAQLRSLADAFPLPVPQDGRDAWGPEVWEHIQPKALRHVEFLRKYYAAPGMERFQLAIMLSMASPFMAFVTGEYVGGAQLPNNSSLTVSLYSRETARGKTTAAQSAILAYGRPGALSNDSGKAGATVNGRLGVLSLHGTLPSIMDEMGDLTPSEVATTVSSVANGAGKRTLTATRTLRQEATWALINIITTNVSQRDMVAVARSASGPVLYRLLEIDVDNMPEFSQECREGFRADWREVTRDCAGALGALIHREICALGAVNMLNLVGRCVSRAEKLVEAGQSARFQSRGLGAMLALEVILRRLGIKMFNLEDLTAVFKTAHDANVDYVAENTLPTNPLQLLSMALIDLAQNTIVTQNESWGGHNRVGVDRPLNARVPDVVQGRHILSTGVTYLSVDALRDWSRERGVSDRAMIDAAKVAQVLQPRIRRVGGTMVQRSYEQKSLTRGLVDGMNLRCNAYTFNVRRLNQLLQTADTGFELVEGGPEEEQPQDELLENTSAA